MSKLRCYQVDAFSSRVFGGNPAAVVPLPAWLDDSTMQAIAAENNLAETAFCVTEKGEPYGLRWFTPAMEVKLCGHATLATAHVLFTALEPQRRKIRFSTASGELAVQQTDAGLSMDFPIWELVPIDAPLGLSEALGAPPREVWITKTEDNLFAIYESEASIRTLRPDMVKLAALHPAGVVVTAPGIASDCVCRYFAPSYGVDEDFGTGSIHCGLAAFWGERLGKPRIHSLQLSSRGAELYCERKGGRTLISGQAVTYLEGWIDVGLQGARPPGSAGSTARARGLLMVDEWQG